MNDTTGHAKIPFNLKTPFGSYSFEVLTMQWNYIYIESNLSNSVIVPFVNGVSVSLSPASTSSGYGVSLNLNSFEIFNDSVGLSNYCIFDEIRVCRSFADKVFPQQPFDSNMVYVYPASPSENDVVVQSALNVSSYRVGGARPTYPSNGTVFINVDKNVVKNIMQYDGGLWKDVNAAIYKNGEWFNLMNFDLAPITSSEDEIPPVTDGEDPGGSGSGSGGSGEVDGSDSSLWDKLFGSIGDVVGAIASGALTILTKIVEGLATLITTLFNAFSDFSGIADGFSGFLSDVFPYIPPEIISLLILGISLSIAMAFIRFLRG